MTTTLDEGEHAILLVCRKEREYILFGLTVSSLLTPSPLSSKWTFFRKKMQKIYTSCCKLICDISVDEATDQTWTQPFFLHDCKERKLLLPFKKYQKKLPGALPTFWTYHNMVASLSQTVYSNNFTKMVIKQCRQLIILVNFIIKIDCALKHDHSITISDAFPISCASSLDVLTESSATANFSSTDHEHKWFALTFNSIATSIFPLPLETVTYRRTPSYIEIAKFEQSGFMTSRDDVSALH